MKKINNKTEVISFRVPAVTKDKIMAVYGGYTPLCSIIEDNIFKNEIENPSVVELNDRRIKDIDNIINMYHDIHDTINLSKKKLDRQYNKISDEINKLESEKHKLISNNISILRNVEAYNNNHQQVVEHSVQEVVEILEQNKKQREHHPTERISIAVIRNYANNCGLSVKSFKKLLPTDLLDNIEQ